MEDVATNCIARREQIQGRCTKFPNCALVLAEYCDSLAQLGNLVHRPGIASQFVRARNFKSTHYATAAGMQLEFRDPFQERCRGRY